jgi:preprotein translocase subunit SecG
MVTILISLFMFVLLVVSLLMTVIILMQKPSENAGMGAALGGGAAESVFGGEASGALLKFTVRISVVFFVLSFLLYLFILAHNRPAAPSGASLPTLGIPAAPAMPVAPAAATSKAAASTSMPAASASTAAAAPAPKATSTPISSSNK